MRSSMVSSASASDSWVIVGSETMIVGVGGALVAEAKRRIVTLRLFTVRPYPTDKDLEEIAVELVSAGCDDEARGCGWSDCLVEFDRHTKCEPLSS